MAKAQAGHNAQREINQRIGTIAKLSAQRKSDFLEIGKELIEIRKLLDHGDWMAWLSDNAERLDMNYHAARRAWRAAKLAANPKFCNLQNLTKNTIDKLVDDAVPPGAVDEIFLELAKHGKVSIKEADRILNKWYAKAKKGKKSKSKKSSYDFDPWPTSTTVWDTMCDQARERKAYWDEVTGEKDDEDSLGGQRQSSSGYSGDSSKFNPWVAEGIINRYAKRNVPPGGKIIDPYAGRPIRGLVAGANGYEYYGYDIRDDAVEEGNTAALANNMDDRVRYFLGDATDLMADDLDAEWEYRKAANLPQRWKRPRLRLGINEQQYDFCFTCPPYYDLEVYSTDTLDVSTNKSYSLFLRDIRKCVSKLYDRLRPGAYACWVVGNFRNSSNNDPLDDPLIDFSGDLRQIFKDEWFRFCEEIIIHDNPATAAIRADNADTYNKRVRVHQNLLVFKKPGDDLKFL